MLNVKEGLTIVQKNFPNRCYTTALEFEDSYLFCSFDRSWDGDPDTEKVGRGPDVVNKKTGAFETLGSGDDFEIYGDFIRKINLDEYLSDGDYKLKSKVLKNYDKKMSLKLDA